MSSETVVDCGQLCLLLPSEAEWHLRRNRSPHAVQTKGAHDAVAFAVEARWTVCFSSIRMAQDVSPV